MWCSNFIAGSRILCVVRTVRVTLPNGQLAVAPKIASRSVARFFHPAVCRGHTLVTPASFDHAARRDDIRCCLLYGTGPSLLSRQYFRRFWNADATHIVDCRPHARSLAVGAAMKARALIGTASFEPKTLAVVFKAFDEAWERLQSEGALPVDVDAIRWQAATTSSGSPRMA
jgi:hypothetical protein